MNKKIDSGTVARTVILIIALMNQTLVVLGKHPLAIVDDSIYEAVSLIITTGAAVAAWWKNNSFTQAALKADEALKENKKNV